MSSQLPDEMVFLKAMVYRLRDLVDGKCSPDHEALVGLLELSAITSYDVQDLADQRDSLVERVDNLEHELVHVRFDQHCLTTEIQELKRQQIEMRLVLGIASQDKVGQAVKRQIDHVAHCRRDIDGYLIQCLEKADISPDRIPRAAIFVNFETGWNVQDCLAWVRANYYQEP